MLYSISRIDRMSLFSLLFLYYRIQPIVLIRPKEKMGRVHTWRVVTVMANQKLPGVCFKLQHVRNARRGERYSSALKRTVAILEPSCQPGPTIIRFSVVDVGMKAFDFFRREYGKCNIATSQVSLLDRLIRSGPFRRISVWAGCRHFNIVTAFGGTV
jgi:hypothetical protein